jgi:hypothetical protein
MGNPARSQTLAGPCEGFDAFEISAKAEDFRHFCQSRAKALAALATLAGGQEWARGIYELIALPCPSFHSQNEWNILSWRIYGFTVEWAADGLRYGWTLLDIFGCNPDPSARRVDRNGVAMTLGRMLSPLTVAAVDADAWHLADQRGSLLRFTRMARPGQVPLWTAYSAHSGP